MSRNEPIRLLLADDDDLVRDGLAMVLQQSGEFLVASAVCNGAKALEALSHELPDVVLLDIRMPDMDGLQCCRKIREQYPELPILMLTTFQDDAYLAEAIEAGARGYLLKHQSAEAVMLGIRNAVSGNVSFEPGVARSLGVRSTTGDEAFLEGLPARAVDVLRRLVEGSSNREIAEQLYLSEGTVRNYISELLQFADVRDRTQLVIWYYRAGSFEP
ncbi:MAG: response regulator [Spirochaetes bacterium]|nr:response regulator [Spirochaetota bacterium]